MSDLKDSLTTLLHTKTNEVISAMEQNGYIATKNTEFDTPKGKIVVKTKPKTAKVRRAVRKLQNNKPSNNKFELLLSDKRVKEAIKNAVGKNIEERAQRAIEYLLISGKMSPNELDAMNNVSEEEELKQDLYVMNLFKEVVDVPDEFKEDFAEATDNENSIYWELDIEQMRGIVNSFRPGIA